jgi:hypothetical protein
MHLTLTVLATLALGTTLVAADFTGTWKLNSEKSKIRGNNFASSTMTISQTGPNTYVHIVDNVTKSGESEHQEFTRIYDGKEHPRTGVGLRQEGATEIAEQINPTTLKITQKKDGTVLAEITSMLSTDGNVITNRRTTGKTKEVFVFARH